MNKVSYDENEEPIVLSKPLSDLILKQDHPAELLSLYWFYYYTAKWQRTNIPRATNDYVADALKWGSDKVKKYRKILIQLGLIETIQRKNENNNQITGYYTKVKFIWSKDHPLLQKASGVKIHPQENNTTNALSTNINTNALSTNKDNVGFFQKTKDSITTKKFNEFWQIYPRKDVKGKALTEWNKLCAKKNGEKPSWPTILNALEAQKKTQRWKKGFVPLPATWIHQQRWVDDPAEMKSWNDNEDKKFIPSFDEMGKNFNSEEDY
ncbi:MAG: hypothetical protein M0R17_06305 [Candidatus Omnitrophica bacterium]|jgi:hypothetical protein|nr:hypothetical protein [Candidatus Omnitrophota bacterium]